MAGEADGSTPPARLHAHELAIDTALVRRLVAKQFPQWAGFQVEALPIGGTDNAIFRLGDALSVRLPRRPIDRSALDREFAWLPLLAPRLPVRIPVPIARGLPGTEYPSPWAVHGWLPGEDAAHAPLDLRGAAVALAAFIGALRRVDTAGGPAPRNRGGPLAPRDEAVRASLAALGDEVDVTAVTAAWEEALAAPPWRGEPVWIHGDLDARNLLVEGGRITAVLDWAELCVGDPACDVKVAWAVLDSETRTTFRERLAVDDATWARARGWAISQAVIALPYYRGTYSTIVEQARRWLDEALTDA